MKKPKENLDQLRLEVRLLCVKTQTTQQALADLFFAHPATISHAITGTRSGRVHIDLLKKIQKHLSDKAEHNKTRA